MTVARLALSELKRMTGGLLPKLTILSLALVPLLYGAVYLYANWDPYSHLDQLKAAVVVDDRGATTADGKQLAVGSQVADNLIQGHKFDWVKVDSDQAAANGVASGEYAFALSIPQDFSANLASPENFDAVKQAMLNVTTNDANNYLLTSIVDKVTTQVHASVAQQVGETTADALLTGYGTIHGQIVKAADGAKQLADGAASLKDGASQLHSGTGTLASGARTLADGQSQLAAGADQLSTGAGALSSGLHQLRSQTASLPADTKALSDGASQVAAGNATLNTKVQNLAGSLDQLDAAAKKDYGTVLSSMVANGTISSDQAAKITAAVDGSPAAASVQAAKAKLQTDAADVQKLADGSQSVASGASTLAAATPALTGAIAQADDGAAKLASGAATLASGEQSALDGSNQLADGAAKLDSGAAALDDGASKLSAGARELSDQLAKGAGQVPNPTDAQKATASKVISDPVGVQHASQASAGTYGAGLAPFFLVLALWIGAFMLVQAMRPVTQRALASNAPSWTIAVGGWLPFFAVSVVQAAVLYAVVEWGLGLNAVHPWLALGLMLLAAMAFTALIQGIVALLGTPGKMVVLILLVLQLVASGGTFPWQTTPGPLHVIHQIMPMGHVVDGMRHLLYGADLAPLVPIVAALLGYTLLGVALSIVAVRKHKFWTLKTLQPEITV